jgi:hypothetical protein
VEVSNPMAMLGAVAQEERRVPTDNTEWAERSAIVLTETRRALQRLQTGPMACEAMADHGRAVVTHSRALLGSLRRNQ